MKKAFAGLAVAVLLGATCVGFAACGEDTPDGKDEEKGEGSPNEIVSDKITAEEFAAAFDDALFENFKVEIEVEEIRTDEEGGQVVCTRMERFKQTIRVENGRAYTKVTAKRNYTGELPEYSYCEKYKAEYATTELEYYYPIIRESLDKKYIVQENGKWVYTGYTPDYTAVWPVNFYQGSVRIDGWPMSWVELASEEMLNASNYEYSDEYKGYLYKVEDTILVAKFKDGKLKALYIEVDYGRQVQNISVLITYGGQSVTLPTVNE